MDATPGRLRDICYEEYPRLVGALRLACGGNAHLAEEYAQEALTRLCRDWQVVSIGPSPRAWLYKTGLNLVKSYWRRELVRRRVEPRLERDLAVPDHAEDAANRDIISRAMAELTHSERCVVVLRHFLQLSVSETAVVLSKSELAVRSLNHRAIGKLRIALYNSSVEASHG